MVLNSHDTKGYTPTDDKIATDYALHWMLAHWHDMPRLLSYHWKSMWSSYTNDDNLPYRQHPLQLSSQVVAYMISLMPLPVFLLAIFGLLVTWSCYKKQLTIEPLLILLAGGALWWLTCDTPGTLRYRCKQNKQHRLSPKLPIESVFEHS